MHKYADLHLLMSFLYHFSYHIFHFSMTFPSLFEISVKLLLNISTCVYMLKEIDINHWTSQPLQDEFSSRISYFTWKNVTLMQVKGLQMSF